MNASGASGGPPFNPKILKWARERRGLTLEEVAVEFNNQVNKVTLWESGEATPTVNQGRRLADLYGRPFLEFFAASIPDIADVELVPDFRFYPGRPSQSEVASLKEVQRWAEEQRLNALDLLDELGEDVPRLKIPRYDSSDNVDTAAAAVRDHVGFPLAQQTSLSAAERIKLPQILRDYLEKSGILVLKQSGIMRLRTRGVCLFAEPLPVIIFGVEAPSAQAFTLAHELGHVALGKSGISGPPRFGKSTPVGRKAVEGWCNRFAAAFLIPHDALSSVMVRPTRPMDAISNEAIDNIAKRFAVSPHATTIRLVNAGYVAASFYWKIKRPQFLEEEQSYKGFGIPKYYGNRYVSSNGRFYTGLVLEAWQAGQITSHSAAEYMGITRLKHLKDIRDNFRLTDA